MPIHELPCACATARRAARLLTQLYDNHLRPSQVEAAQFGMLSVLSAMPGCSQAAIGRALDFDKTTLSRNLKLLKNKGWVQPAAATGVSKDGRQRGFVLTAAGKERLEAAKPRWKKAQDRLRESMSPKEWDAMWKVFATLTDAAREATKNS